MNVQVLGDDIEYGFDGFATSRLVARRDLKRSLTAW